VNETLIRAAARNEQNEILTILEHERDTYKRGIGFNYRQALNNLIDTIRTHGAKRTNLDDPFNAGRKLGRYLESKRILEHVLNDAVIQTNVDVNILERLTAIIEDTQYS